MKSYVYGEESRGPGAIAASDLGASTLPVRTTSMTTAPLALRVAAPILTSSRVSTQAPGVRRRVAPKGRRLIARRRRGTVPATWRARAGQVLSIPSKSVRVSAAFPTRRAVVAPGVINPKDVSSAFSTTIIEKPGAATTYAGAITGNPQPLSARIPIKTAAFSAAHTPSGPTLQRAVAMKNRAMDVAAEMDMDAAGLTAPQITAAESPDEKATTDSMKRLLIIGGVGVGALALIYLMGKKK